MGDERRRRRPASYCCCRCCCLPSPAFQPRSFQPRPLLPLLLLLLLLSLAATATAAAAAPQAVRNAASKRETGARGGRSTRSSGSARRSVGEALLSPSSSSSSSSEQRQHQQRASLPHSPAFPSLHQQRWDREATKEKKREQCFPYSRSHSVAAASFRFPLVDELSGSPTGRSSQAQRGQIVPLRCDSVVCPPPIVHDCYMNDAICDKDKEYCLLEDHVKFGPAAAGANGATPLVAYLDCSFFAAESKEYPRIWENVCSNRSDWGPWTTTRGRCVPYRKEQQSCSGSIWRPQLISKSSSSSLLLRSLAPHYAASTKDGRPPLRPLICGPGLHCTGDAPPTPNTCVKARPSNVCFQGPWWDSTSPGACPRADLVKRWNEEQQQKKKKNSASSSPSSSSPPPPPGGLPLPDLLAAATAFLANAPVEVFESPLNPRYWSDASLQSARKTAAAALEALWPEQYRSLTRFPLRLPEPQGRIFSREWNATAVAVHASYRQIGRAWAAVHTLIHNAPEALTQRQAEASAALALWLRQHVTCCNCRGFFSQLLNEVGLPPVWSLSRTEHARWWWRTHNAVSEHAASTRGGHPFLYPSMPDADFALRFGAEFGNKQALRCQNPWFLGWEDAVEMWTFFSSPDDAGAGAAEKGEERREHEEEGEEEGGGEQQEKVEVV